MALRAIPTLDGRSATVPHAIIYELPFTRRYVLPTPTMLAPLAHYHFTLLTSHLANS